MRTCSKCKIEKPLTEFYLKLGGSRYRSNCKACIKIAGAKHYIKNRTKIAASNLAWYTANKKSFAETAKRWRKNNPEKVKKKSSDYRKRNIDKCRKVCADWAKRNRNIVNENSSRKRAVKSLATPAWTNHVAVREFYSFAGVKSKLTGEKWTVDHIVPLNSELVCGLHTHYNLQVILGSENSSKHNRRWPDMP